MEATLVTPQIISFYSIIDDVQGNQTNIPLPVPAMCRVYIVLDEVEYWNMSSIIITHLPPLVECNITDILSN